MFCPLSSRSASVLHLFHQSHPQAITRQLIHGQDALWAAHNGVLERALREQSCARVRRILLRLPGEHDNIFSDRKTWFGMAFIETVSALMN
ncbi:hypothetical protein DNQ57_27180, partial [Escherichia coli]